MRMYHPIPSKYRTDRYMQGAIAFYQKRIRMTDGYENGSMETDYDNLMGRYFYRKRNRKGIRNRTKGDAALFCISYGTLLTWPITMQVILCLRWCSRSAPSTRWWSATHTDTSSTRQWSATLPLSHLHGQPECFLIPVTGNPCYPFAPFVFHAYSYGYGSLAASPMLLQRYTVMPSWRSLHPAGRSITQNIYHPICT